MPDVFHEEKNIAKSSNALCNKHVQCDPFLFGLLLNFMP